MVVQGVVIVDDVETGAYGEQVDLRRPGRDHVSDQLLTVSEVASEMRVSNMTVYRLIKAGELMATRVGRSYRIWRHEVDAYLLRGAVGS